MWIDENFTATAPPGMTVSKSQRIKNKIMCFSLIVAPWQKQCQDRGENNCDETTRRWLEKNFKIVDTISPTCPGHFRKTYMINVR